jgi:glutamate synthase domain-containing protein 2
VDGAEGGTGAAPIDFSNYVGMPWEDALLFVVDTLNTYKLKQDIKVITATKIFTAFDLFKALCIGADVCNSARGMMLALGCVQSLK